MTASDASSEAVINVSCKKLRFHENHSKRYWKCNRLWQNTCVSWSYSWLTHWHCSVVSNVHDLLLYQYASLFLRFHREIRVTFLTADIMPNSAPCGYITNCSCPYSTQRHLVTSNWNNTHCIQKLADLAEWTLMMSCLLLQWSCPCPIIFNVCYSSKLLA